MSGQYPEKRYCRYGDYVVNDGSTDGTLSLLETCTDDRLRVISKNNEGNLVARRIGVEAAKGDWIGFCDADDWIEKDMYSVMLRAADMFQADIVCCGYYEDYDNGFRRNYGGGHTGL